MASVDREKKGRLNEPSSSNQSHSRPDTGARPNVNKPKYPARLPRSNKPFDTKVFKNSSVTNIKKESLKNPEQPSSPENEKNNRGRRRQNSNQRYEPRRAPTGVGTEPFPPTSSPPPEAYLDVFTNEFDAGPLRDFFTNTLTPLYGPMDPRYFENMANHPLYQQQQRQSYQQITEVMQTMSIHGINVIQVPHTIMQVPGAPERYINNAMRHPLLYRSLTEPQGLAMSGQPVMVPNVSPIQNQGAIPKHNKKKVKKKERKSSTSRQDEEAGEDRKFDDYLTKEQVEEGLKNNTLIEGVLRINAKQFQNAYVSGDRAEQDILIDTLKHRNRALEGDIVIVQLLPEEEVKDSEDSKSTDKKETSAQNEGSKQKRGKVVHIKEKVHTRTCVGTLKLMPDRNKQRALFIPRDYRIPRLNIPFTSWPDNFYRDAKKYEETLFLARIIDWFDTRFALGVIVCLIGQSGDMVSESRAILAQNDLDITPYGPEVRHLYPRLDFVIPEEEIKLREDCRNQCIFSIDPFSCRDIDDAMSCRELPNGNYEIGVHISDVSYYLDENTILDEIVSKKATTIYMVERAYHMLPDELCMLCSLFPGVDKLAFSVFWEITKNAEVIGHRFAKTIINSCAQLAYEHAQAVLDDKETAEAEFPEIHNGYTYKDLHEIIKILGKISATFRHQRFSGGALRIDQPKVSFHLDPANGLPDTFCIYDSKESHQLIEEFMLLANMTVAERIHDDYPKLAFLRSHPPPSMYMLRQLEKSLKPMGIELNISSAGDIHKSLMTYTSQHLTDDKVKGRTMVLNMLCAKPMTRAKYFCADGCDDDDFWHYALNVPLYTHFTSPIRRYADIMVHRLLSASMNHRAAPTWPVDHVRGIAAQCNKQKYNAKKASEMSTELYTLKYIEMHSPVVTEAVVVEVKEKYIDVIVAAMGLNRRIYFNNDFPGKHQCIKNDAGSRLSKMEIIWKATDSSPEVTQVIEVFDTLNIEMCKGDDMVKIETKLIRPSNIAETV